MILLRHLIENTIQTMQGEHCRIIYGNYQDGYMIHSIRTETKFLDKGYALNLLRTFIKKCDSENKAIYLLVSPLNKTTKMNKLINLYQKVGFKLTGHVGNPAGDPYMKRDPLKLI